VDVAHSCQAWPRNDGGCLARAWVPVHSRRRRRAQEASGARRSAPAQHHLCGIVRLDRVPPGRVHPSRCRFGDRRSHRPQGHAGPSSGAGAAGTARAPRRAPRRLLAVSAVTMAWTRAAVVRTRWSDQPSPTNSRWQSPLSKRNSRPGPPPQARDLDAMDIREERLTA